MSIMSLSRARRCALALPALLLAGLPAADPQPQYAWQETHATVDARGHLSWAPRPFTFQVGSAVRYIDYENGDDSAAGTKDAPWKHHPWDEAATGQAAAADDGALVSYVFKGGVTYRGALAGGGTGSADEPIRLTRDPAWGDGAAVITGARRISGGWQRAGSDGVPEDMPEGEAVWFIELDGEPPRTLWRIGSDGEPERLPIARTPNWTVTDPDDIKSEWYEWDWDKRGKKEVDMGRKTRELTLGGLVDELPKDPDYYEGALVYSEWGPVMGTPTPIEIPHYDRESHSIAMPGFWGGGGLKIFGGNRYYLEKHPPYLDAADEWLFVENGPHQGKLFYRPADGVDPNDEVFEAGEHSTLIRLASGSEHVVISGLEFRYTNVGPLDKRPIFGDDADVACVWLKGSGQHITVSNCTFTHINRAVRMKAVGGQDDIDHVAITDNELTFTDHGAFTIADGGKWAMVKPPRGRLGHVDILRNKLFMIGMRPARAEHGHAVDLRFPETAHIAGNILDRGYGAGLFIFAGKPSRYLGDAPFTRIIIHQNQVTDPLLNTNDWGGIETWQGGPYYVFNNVSGNPGGYWHWAQRQFGFAYYLDGAFKNYHFNNIAWGTEHEGPRGNTSAFQEIHSFQNTFFNNTAYNFVNGSRRQAAMAGRDKFLGNIFHTIGDWVFWHAKPVEEEAQANAHHAGEDSEEYHIETNAYAANVLHDIKGKVGVIEPSGRWLRSLESFTAALEAAGPMAAGVGVQAESSPLRNAAEHDFRLAEGSPAVDTGVQVFVPWALSAVVGEWNFTRNSDNPARVIDEHWYMTPYYADRSDYEFTPRYPLMGQGINAGDYTAGALEDWTDAGALRLDGESQYLRVSHADLIAPYEFNAGQKAGGKQTVAGADKKTVDIHDSNMLIEVYLQVTSADGIIAAKMADGVGYALDVQAGKLRLRLHDADGQQRTVVSKQRVDSGDWHHVVADIDRDTGISLFIDGEATPASVMPPAGSLANGGDFVVGGSAEGDHLAGVIDFLRVARGSLADAKTTIDELRAWQFDGPQLRDFTGSAPTGDGRDAGALELK